MKWYIIPAVLICGLNCTLSTVVLCLAIFHLYTDKSTNPPIFSNEEWICRVTGLIPFSLAWLVVSLMGVFVSMARNRMTLASTVMLLHVVCFGTAIYFTLAFGAQLGMEDVTAEALFNKTLNDIASHKPNPDPYIPEWLENVQKQSKQCCGIITYRDYEQFWPDSPTRIPRSCCRPADDLVMPCPNDLTNVPYPNTPDNFYKVETGCIYDINESTRIHIQESYHNCVIVSVFVGLAVLAFLLVYVKRYLVGAPDLKKKLIMPEIIRRGADIDSDILSKNITQLARGEEQRPTSFDSLEGAPPPITSSIDSIPQYQPIIPPPSSTPAIITEPVLYKEPKEAPQYPESSPKKGTANIQIAATQAASSSKQPVASTGEDMNIGASGLGRHEVYVVQDAIFNDTAAPGRGPVTQSSNSTDDIGDMIHGDENGVTTPPGSPGGRKKKVRKAGMPHHHKNHHPHKEQPQ